MEFARRKKGRFHNPYCYVGVDRTDDGLEQVYVPVLSDDVDGVPLGKRQGRPRPNPSFLQPTEEVPLGPFPSVFIELVKEK